jgi:hypothetical protein
MTKHTPKAMEGNWVNNRHDEQEARKAWRKSAIASLNAAERGTIMRRGSSTRLSAEQPALHAQYVRARRSAAERDRARLSAAE